MVKKNREQTFRPRYLSQAIRAVLASALVAAAVEAPDVQALSCPISTSVSLSGSDTNSIFCTITTTGQLDVLAGAVLLNQQTGTLSNAGSLINRSAGRITNSRGYLLNEGSGTLKNYGLFENTQYGSRFSNAGTFTNYGTLNNIFSANQIVNSGTLNNNGSLNNNQNNTLINTGSLNNSGVLTQGGTFTNTGTLINTGTINVQSSGVMDGAGIFSQTAGVTTVDGVMSQSNINIVGGTLTNNGTLNQNGTLTNSDTINNSGTLNSFGTFSGSGSLNNTGTLTVNDLGVSGPYGTVYQAGNVNIASSSNLSGNTLSGGAWVVNEGTAGASLSFGNGITPISTLTTGTSVTLNGAGATFSQIDGLTSNAGALTISGGGSFSLASNSSNSGTLTVDSGTSSNFSALDVIAGRTLNNSGTITINSRAILNSHGSINGVGALNLAGGQLTIYQGGSVSVGSSSNLTGSTLTGGFWDLQAGTGSASLSFGNGVDPISTLGSGAVVSLSGAGAQFAQLENSLTSLTNSQLLIANGHVFIQSQVLANNGQLIAGSGGLIKNYGTVNNAYSGGLLATSVGGTFRNYGTINDNSGYYSPSSNNGTLNNYGTLNSSGRFENNGTLTNAGAFNVTALGVTGTGTFTQTAGITKVDGALFQAAISISGGLLGGDGELNSTGGPVAIGPAATINPGGSITNDPGDFTGSLAIGSIDIEGTLNIEIAGLLDFDTVTVFNDITFNPGSTIEFDLDGWQPSAGDSLDFLFADTLTGFGNITYSFLGLDPNLDFDVLLTPTADLQLTFANAVPIPASLWLFGSGMLGLASLAKRKAT